MNHLLSALACKLCRLGPNLKVGKKLYLQIIHSSQWSLLDEGASRYDRLTYPMISPLKICVQRWHHRVTQSQVARFDLTMSTPHGKSTSLLPTGRVTPQVLLGHAPPKLKTRKAQHCRRLWTVQHAKGIFNGFRKSKKAMPFDPIIGPSQGLRSCFDIWAARVRDISHSPELKLRKWLKPQWSGISGRDPSKMPWEPDLHPTSQASRSFFLAEAS